jgi:hypothetical protein
MAACQPVTDHALLVVTGALKTLGANKDSPIPIQLFDISDVVLLDSDTETVRGHSMLFSCLQALACLPSNQTRCLLCTCA